MIDPRAQHQAEGMGWGTKLVLIGFAVGAVMMLILIALSFIVPRVIDGAIETYTDAAPSVPALPETTAEERDAIQARVDDFADELDAGTARESFVLTEHDVNALLAESLEDKEDVVVGVELLPGQVRAQLSLRLTQALPLGPWTRDLTGRYLNGIATFNAAVRNGALDLHLAAFEVKGRPLPERVLSILRDEIAKSGVLDDEGVQEFIDKVGSVNFQSGQVTITPPK
jgi:hypothetical protein